MILVSDNSYSRDQVEQVTDCIAGLLRFRQPVRMPMKTKQKIWLGNRKAVTQGQSFHYCQLIQALAPIIISLFPYELVLIESYPSIESILESKNKTPTQITVTDMSQSGTLLPTPGIEHVEPEQTPPSLARIHTTTTTNRLYLPCLLWKMNSRVMETVILDTG